MASVSKRPWTYKGVTKEAWTVRYVDRDGTHRSKKCASKKEADAYCRQVENELEVGSHIAHRASPTFKSIAADFIAKQDERLEAGEIGRGRRDCLVMSVNNYIVPRLGAKRLAETTASDLEKWHRDIVAVHKLAPRTSRLRLNAIAMMYSFVIDRGLPLIDPVPATLRLIGRRKVTVIRTFKKEEINSLLVALQGTLPKLQPRGMHYLRCAVYLALFCGLRAGEIRALKIENVDLDGGVLRIRHNLTPYMECKGPKSAAGVRDLAMPAPVTSLLREQVSRFTAPSDDGWLFTTHKGTPFGAAFLGNNAWRPLLVKAGLLNEGATGLHFHALRHFMVSYLLDNQTPIARVSRMAGHSTPKITLGIYTHLIGDEVSSEPVDGMALALLGSATPMLTCATVAQNPANPQFS